MTFSKKEREFLRRSRSNDRMWYNKNFTSVYPKVQKKKQAYYRLLKSRIRKKVKRMEEDLYLFENASTSRLSWLKDSF